MGVPFRFIHAADLHVDSPFRGLADAPPHVREALADSTFAAVRRLTELAVASDADFIVIAGDLYDAADRSLRAQLALQREWEKLHAHGVQLFVIHGNHDHLSGAQAGLSLPANVTVFGPDKAEAVPAFTKRGGMAAWVQGISYGSRAVTENLAARYKPVADGAYEIAMLHGNVQGDLSHDPYAPCSLSELAAAGFHYWALGHIHKRAVLHADPFVVYAGNPQGRHSRETGAKGCYIVDVTVSQETRLTFASLDAIRFANVEADIAGLESEQALLDAMESALLGEAAGCEGRPLMARVRLTGRGFMHRKLTDANFAKELLEGLRSRLEYGIRETGIPWIWVTSLDTATGADLRMESLASEDSFAGELYRQYAASWSGVPGAEALAEEALAPLQSNARLRKLLRSLPGELTAEWAEQAKEVALGHLVDGAEPGAAKPDHGGENAKV